MENKFIYDGVHVEIFCFFAGEYDEQSFAIEAAAMVDIAKSMKDPHFVDSYDADGINAYVIVSDGELPEDTDYGDLIYAHGRWEDEQARDEDDEEEE